MAWVIRKRAHNKLKRVTIRITNDYPWPDLRSPLFKAVYKTMDNYLQRHS